MLFSMTRRRRARHAAKPTPSPSRQAPSGAAFTPLPPGTMRQRGTDYSDPAPLAWLRDKTASDGHTVVMRTVTLPAPTGPARGCTDATVTLTEAAAVVNRDTWYSPCGYDEVEWRDAPDDPPPSLVATSLSDSGERALSTLESHLAAMGNSALRHRTGVADAWFRPGRDNGDQYARSLSAYLAEQEHAAQTRDRALALLNNRWSLAHKSRPVDGVMDTSVFATVAYPQFLSEQREAAR